MATSNGSTTEFRTELIKFQRKREETKTALSLHRLKNTSVVENIMSELNEMKDMALTVGFGLDKMKTYISTREAPAHTIHILCGLHIPAPNPLAAIKGWSSKLHRLTVNYRIEGADTNSTIAAWGPSQPSGGEHKLEGCLLYTSPSPRDKRQSRMPSSA